MANRILTTMLVVTAVLAIGWTVLVLLWNPQPDIASIAESTDAISSGPVSTSTRESQSVTPDPEPDTSDPAPDNGDETVPVLDISMGIDEIYRMVSEMGVDADEFKTRFQSFFCGSGWASEGMDAGLFGCVLEQPYEQYETEILRQLAEGGDMWAQQFLASRIQFTRPAEAVEWFRRAAAQGSAHAAENIADVYNSTGEDFLKQANITDEKMLEQWIALKDAAESPATLAAAWSGVSHLMAGRSVGTSMSFYGNKLNDEQFDGACDLAEELYAELQAEHPGAQSGPIRRRVSPLLMTAQPEEKNQCDGDLWSAPKTSHCGEFTMTVGSVAGATSFDIPDMQGWICPN